MITVYNFITDSDEGTNAQTFTDKSDALEALYAFAIEAGYKGLKSQRLIMEWKEKVYEVEGGIDEFYIAEQQICVPQLNRVHTALQQCIVALDMDDQFGNDIDARHSAEEDAFHMAKSVLPDPYPPQPYFLILGRFEDGENCWYTKQADSLEQAVESWKVWMRESFDPDASELLYIEDTWRSDTPIDGDSISERYLES